MTTKTAENVYTNTEILADLRRVYAQVERPFSRSEYATKGKISKSTVERRFGTWTNALRQAKLLSKFEKDRKVAAKKR